MRGYLALMVFAVVSACYAADDMELLKMIRSQDVQERNVAVGMILKEQKSTISDLENIIRELADIPERGGTVRSAIELLGYLRSERSVPLLVQHLTLQVFYKETKRTQGVDDLFPAVGALIKIGIPSVDPVLERVGLTDDPTVIRTSAAVLRGVLGIELAKTKIDMEARKKSHDPAVSRRLGSLGTSLALIQP